MELSFSAPYTAMTRERTREKEREREREKEGDGIQPRETGGGREERGQIKGREGQKPGKKLRQMDGAGRGGKDEGKEKFKRRRRRKHQRVR